MEIIAKMLSIELSREEAQQLYTELTLLFREMDVDYAPNRSKHPEIALCYRIYDELYRQGIS